MTLDEAVKDVLSEIQGRFQAVRTAENGGKPILLPGGRTIGTMQPPSIGDLLLTTLKAQLVLIQCINHVAGTLQGGFVLSDQEASRLADLVVARIRDLDTKPGEAEDRSHEVQAGSHAAAGKLKS